MPLDGLTQTLPAIYAMTTGDINTTGTYDLFDVTTGHNSVGSAGPGYDVVTGKGTPRYASQAYTAAGQRVVSGRWSSTRKWLSW